MPPSFFRAFVRPLALAVGGVLLVGLGLGWHSGDDASYDRGYADAQVARLLHAKAVATRRADSLAALATRAETVYVATRRRASAEVAKLPPMETAGDTIVLTEGRFPVARPVVALVVAQARAIEVQKLALTQADTTIAAKNRVIFADSLRQAETDSIVAVQARVIVAQRKTDRWRTVKEWGLRALIAGTAYTVGKALP